MENYEDQVDQQELTGLIYFQKQPIWCGVLKDLLLLDSVSYAAKGARDFATLARELSDRGEHSQAMDMTIVAEQLAYWADTSEGVSTACAYFGIRQLVRPSIVMRDNLLLYAQKLLVLARIPGSPKPPDFALLVGDENALYVTEDNDMLAENAGEIASEVLNQASLDKICGDLMR